MNRKSLFALLWFCFIAEVGSITFLRGVTGIYFSPILFIVSGCASVSIMIKLYPLLPTAPSIHKKPSIYIFPAVVFAALVICGLLKLTSFYNTYTIDPKGSDIIPHLQVLVHRFLNGQTIYEEVNDFGYTIYPNYPTLTWLPFVLAQKLGIDYRTWSYLILCICIATFFIFIPVKSKRQLWLTMLLPATALGLYLALQPSAFGWTIETMIAGFYILLLAGLYMRSFALISIALLFCLLSRYSVALWCPFFLVMLFFFKSRKEAVLILSIIGLGITTLFILPYVVPDPNAIIKGFEYYTTCAIAEWRGQSWQAAGELPHQLTQGYGFAIYFYKWIGGTMKQRLSVLQLSHVAISLVVLCIMALWYKSRGSNLLPLHWFFILSLKVYIIFFFAFIQVPYAYLFITPLLLSAVIMALFTGERQLK